MKVFGITDPIGNTGTMYTDQIKIADEAIIDGCEVVTYVPELDLIEAKGELFALESQWQEAHNTILKLRAECEERVSLMADDTVACCEIAQKAMKENESLRAENAKLAETLRGLRPLVSYGGTY